MNTTRPEWALERVLTGLEKELVGAADEEIELAAADLGMNVRMKGSAAFLGVMYTFPKRLEDIFDFGKAPRRTRPDLPKSGKKDRDDGQ